MYVAEYLWCSKLYIPKNAALDCLTESHSKCSIYDHYSIRNHWYIRVPLREPASFQNEKP